MEWRLIPDMDARYEASRDGRVRSWGRSSVPHLLKPKVDKDGYLYVDLRVAGEDKHFRVSRLVLAAFTGRMGEQSNHLNGIRDDNRFCNLEWCTASENVTHAFRVLGRKHSCPNKGLSGSLHWNSKRVVQRTLDGVLVREWASIADAAREGFSQPCITRVCKGTSRHHKGFVWAFSNQTNSI